MLTKAFNIRDQMRSRVVIDAPLRKTPAAAALIEQNDPVKGRVEKPALSPIASATWSAMQKDDWCAMRVAALLIIDGMAVTDVKQGMVIGCNLRIQSSGGVEGCHKC